MKSLFFIFSWILLATNVKAQQQFVTFKGSIFEKGRNNTEMPVSGAKILFEKKIFAFTDKDGKFELMIPDSAKKLIIQFSHIGSDTITLTNLSMDLKLVYPMYQKLKDIVISEKRFTTEISLLTPQKIDQISSRELLKSACCNLSESFETTPSVDVSFTDAITGYKQIQLLGLAGPYTLITRENIPEVRGLASVSGLTFTPGQWIDGMQLSKGTGSVVNGFEGLAGQINIELKKPMDGDHQFYNVYQSNQGRTEANAVVRFEPRKNIYGNVFLHGKSQWIKMDQNKDHFMDQPIGKTIIVANRWILFNKRGEEMQIGVKYLDNENTGGNLDFNQQEDPATSKLWGLKMKIKRLDVWTKTGKSYVAKPWKSMGLQLSFSNHQQEMQFGKKGYNALEKSGYLNYIYQTIIKNTNRVFKAGFTVQHIERKENINLENYANTESIAGLYSEYAHTFSKKINAVLGGRIDYHSLYGLYVTPRLHVRYAPIDQLALRASIGKAYRTATIFSENPGMFSTNRTILITPSMKEGVYGLQNESAWNTGMNLTYKFKLNYRSGTLSSDYYYTYFINQVVVDWEESPFIKFYNSKKLSYAHSFQVQLDYEPIRKFDVRIAYRYHDIRTTYDNQLMQKPLNARHRAFINMGYQTRRKWSIDYTLQWTGKKRIPSTELNPEEMQMIKSSPSFITMNAQITKAIKNGFECYTGVENLLNYFQKKTIIDSENPFGQYFDASLIWGPTMARTIYIGVRYRKK